MTQNKAHNVPLWILCFLPLLANSETPFGCATVPLWDWTTKLGGGGWLVGPKVLPRGRGDGERGTTTARVRNRWSEADRRERRWGQRGCQNDSVHQPSPSSTISPLGATLFLTHSHSQDSFKGKCQDNILSQECCPWPQVLSLKVICIFQY